MSARGHNRERAVRELLRVDGWFVVRAAGSLGDADLLALKDGERPRLIEVKSTKAGPWHSFGPADRHAIRTAAALAGADALLCWWPPYRDPKWMPAETWPS